MIQKSAPHCIIIAILLFVCHSTHLGQAVIDEQVFGRVPWLEGGHIQKASHYAVPVLAWIAVWKLLPFLAKILIFSGNLIMTVRNLFAELGNIIATWAENKVLVGLYMLVSQARIWLAAEIRKRRKTIV